MPRKARIDAPDALHHIMIRGIEKKPIFKDKSDRKAFLSRLEDVLLDTSTSCYSWVLMGNHVHLLLRTGREPLATVMRRLLTGYAQQFNRRHQRHGPLFQNRYKSILCEEESYFLQLVRYIHLNPIRSGIVKDIFSLGPYPYCGHAVLIGKRKNNWQDRDYVLRYFGPKRTNAVRAYKTFISEGIKEGYRPDLIGGGLIRSIGGWAEVKGLLSQGVRLKGDERILGSASFVEKVLRESHEHFEKRALLKRRGFGIDQLLKQIAQKFDVDEEDIKGRIRIANIADARAAFCYLSLRSLGESGVNIAKFLGLSQSAVSKAAVRGKAIVADKEMEEIFE
jgi:REP element-mobilizing transposase RayT